jgi:hypothetical protein
VNVHAKSHLTPEPLRTLRSEDKGHAGACPDRTRAIPCTVRAVTIQQPSTATAPEAPDSNQLESSPTPSVSWNSGQLPSTAASSGRRGRARCVPDRPVNAGKLRLLPDSPVHRPQQTASRRALAGIGPSHHAHTQVTAGQPFSRPRLTATVTATAPANRNRQRKVEDHCRSAAAVAKPAAKPPDNACPRRTTLEYWPSGQTTTDGSGRCAHSYGSAGWDRSAPSGARGGVTN